MRRFRPTDRVGVLLAGVILLFSCSIAATVVLPAFDEAMETTSEFERTFDRQARRGMRVFSSEGCWYCHTQQVRRTMTDVGYGPALEPGDLAGQMPSMLGAERIGSDLTHVGDRYTDPAELRSFLRDPSREAGGSSMPPYAHLSDRDLDALVAYLQSLR